MAADLLANIPPSQLHGWYTRLALATKSRYGNNSLAAALLLHWLGGTGKLYTFDASYVKDLAETRKYLVKVARPIVLGNRAGPKGKMGGIKARLQGKVHGEKKHGPYQLTLTGNAEVDVVSAQGLLLLFLPSFADRREVDALYALHGYTVCSDVTVSTSEVAQTRVFNVRFDKWICQVKDYYHWNGAHEITVDNPDYGATIKDAVSPGEKR